MTLTLPVPPVWGKRAACAGNTDPDAFFPHEGENNIPDTRHTRSICTGCDVRTECLRWAVEHDEEGIWGGLTKRQRRKLTRPLEPEYSTDICNLDDCDNPLPVSSKPSTQRRYCSRSHSALANARRDRTPRKAS